MCGRGGPGGLEIVGQNRVSLKSLNCRDCREGDKEEGTELTPDA